jgi:hypothetical protein
MPSNPHALGLFAQIVCPNSLWLVGGAGADGLLDREGGDVIIEKQIIEVFALQLIKNQLNG